LEAGSSWPAGSAQPQAPGAGELGAARGSAAALGLAAPAARATRRGLCGPAPHPPVRSAVM